ncbi:MAG: PIN domain-containing protein [Candidatus Brocadia sp.]|nr:PIN domain-containing protein [Candidatus Brocadia sp.]MDG6026776.1 PIN domain-containing protein [Candidatus Brocadia sp.]
MPDKVFIDTNVLIYFISSEEGKKTKAKEVIFSSQEVFISSQVISEFISVCFSKELLGLEEIITLVNDLIEALQLSSVEESTIKKALQVKKNSKYSYWDSLIIASALENNCSILYTEDMQDGQVVDGNLTITNPFKA